MEKFLDLLYNRFFLRDLLSIFSNGAIFLYALLNFFDNIFNFKNLLCKYQYLIHDDFLKYIIIIVIITFIYSLGLIINSVRDFVYFLIFYNKNKLKLKRKCCSKKIKKCFLTAHSININRYYKRKIRIYHNNELNFNYYKSNNDRLVIIFQTLGNTGISLFILSFTFIPNIIAFIIILLLSILMNIIALRVFVHHKILNLVMNKLIKSDSQSSHN